MTATGQSSGLSATAFFWVRTNWAKFHFDNGNSGFNPYENVLSPANVAGLGQVWSHRPAAATPPRQWSTGWSTWAPTTARSTP